jgi:ubiquinone/menaquinone biosynthesis C-methylase UbiE
MGLKPSKEILDLACGTGTMSDLIFEVTPDAAIIGVDIDGEALLLAQAHFEELARLSNRDSNGKPNIYFAQASADMIPLQALRFDAVIMGNSIHMLPDADRLLAEIHRVLRPGGIFAFNSSFYAGTIPKGTEKFHHEWLKQALLYMTRKDAELRKQGLPGIQRKRGTARPAFSKPWPSLEEWTDMLMRHGFEITRTYERTVLMNQRCFETIGAYAGLASVLFSGYPVHLASEALQETAGLTLSLVGMNVVPRLWLEMTAVKK